MNQQHLLRMRDEENQSKDGSSHLLDLLDVGCKTHLTENGTASSKDISSRRVSKHKNKTKKLKLNCFDTKYGTAELKW